MIQALGAVLGMLGSSGGGGGMLGGLLGGGGGGAGGMLGGMLGGGGGGGGAGGMLGGLGGMLGGGGGGGGGAGGMLGGMLGGGGGGGGMGGMMPPMPPDPAGMLGAYKGASRLKNAIKAAIDRQEEMHKIIDTYRKDIDHLGRQWEGRLDKAYEQFKSTVYEPIISRTPNLTEQRSLMAQQAGVRAGLAPYGASSHPSTQLAASQAAREDQRYRDTLDLQLADRRQNYARDLTAFAGGRADTMQKLEGAANDSLQEATNQLAQLEVARGKAGMMQSMAAPFGPVGTMMHDFGMNAMNHLSGQMGGGLGGGGMGGGAGGMDVSSILGGTGAGAGHAGDDAVMQNYPHVHAGAGTLGESAGIPTSSGGQLSLGGQGLSLDLASQYLRGQ